MNNNKEIRLINISNFNIEQRGDGSDKLVIEGYAAVYDTEADIGGFFTETISRGAFDGADLHDVPLKYNHSDAVPILARTRNKSLTVTPDEKGLFVHAELLDTTDGVDMYKRIKAGLIDKMSFAFTVPEGGDDWTNGGTYRRINKFDRIFDVSVVDTPAYDDTSIYARSKAIADANAAALDNADEETRKNANSSISDEAKTILLKQGVIL